MARRKKHAARKHSRRRKYGMGAVRGAGIGDALTVIGGAVLGGVVKKFVPGNDTVKNAVVTAAGLFTPALVKGPMGAKLGAGMVAYGGVGLVSALVDPAGKFIGAISDTLSIPMKVGEVTDNLSVIAGSPSVMAGDPLSVIAGYDEEY